MSMKSALTFTRSMKSGLTSAAVLTLGALALTACQSGTPGAASSASPSSVASGPAAGSSSVAGPAGDTSGRSASAPSASSHSDGTGGTSGVGGTGKAVSASSDGAGGKTGRSGGTGGKGKAGGAGHTSASDGYATSDGYAYKHPCTPQQLSVHVVRRSAAPSQRVIEVHNKGARSCGLSYFPLVALQNAKETNGNLAIKPLIPGGLGGPPASPVYAGHTVYAVIDLDPSGATVGAARNINQMDVLADGDHMPNAATLNFPLGDKALVLKPKLGLYERDIADAVKSMHSANTRP
ncbi:hypothetical protein [Streptomyces beihaiensis]|uniref:DUF4232 domain-containing protein n=1 Tax=Streptomyces beihaiensis TaxID=2984495 RepID=A0ABT3TRV5_9ACTN|nr:hypothetical protein [Streptomyces beihaiensis]MCX3059782.1 hypothetical protein [Streptomyces beihaiensis]